MYTFNSIFGMFNWLKIKNKMEKIGREFDGSDCFSSTIGAGKSSLTALIANRLGSEAFTNQLMIMRYYLYFMRNRKSTRFITNLFFK